MVPLAHFMNFFLLFFFNPLNSFVCLVPASSTRSASSKVPQYSIRPHEHDPLIPPHTAALPPPSSTFHLIHHHRNSNLSPPFRTFTKSNFYSSVSISGILHICMFHIQCINVLYQFQPQYCTIFMLNFILFSFHILLLFHHRRVGGMTDPDFGVLGFDFIFRTRLIF